MELVIRGVIRATAVGMATAASLMIAGAGPAAAGEHVVSATFQYTCYVPSVRWIGSLPMTVRLSWGLVNPVLADQHSQAPGISALGSMTSTEVSLLSSFGATSVQATVEAPVQVHAPQGDISMPLRLQVPRTSIASSGAMEVDATGTAPVIIFRRPGDGSISLDSGFTVELTPLNASGSPTVLGTVGATCTLDAGQNPVLGSFVIDPKPGAPTAVASRAAGLASTSRPTATPASPAPVPTTAPASATGPKPQGPGGIPVAVLLLILAMVTVTVGAIAFISFLAFIAGRRTRPRER